MPMAGCHKSRGKYIVTGDEMMKTANLEKITVLNRKQASDRMVASTCNCSWRYDVHLPAKKSAYEEQKRPNR